MTQSASLVQISLKAGSKQFSCNAIRCRFYNTCHPSRDVSISFCKNLSRVWIRDCRLKRTLCGYRCHLARKKLPSKVKSTLFCIYNAALYVTFSELVIGAFDSKLPDCRADKH